MSVKLNEHIKNVVFKFIKKNYKDYLKTNNIEFIEDDNIIEVIDKMYDEKKEELKSYVTEKIRTHMEDYPGDSVLKPLLNEMVDDDVNSKTRICVEIQYYQDSKKKKRNSNKN